MNREDALQKRIAHISKAFTLANESEKDSLANIASYGMTLRVALAESSINGSAIETINRIHREVDGFLNLTEDV